MNSIRIIIFILLGSLLGCQQDQPSFEQPIQSVGSLEKHTEEFKRQVIEVTEGIFVAVGYGLANSIMIEGDSGRIIIDVMESVQRGEVVRAAFDSISKKPVEAIIYTHNHTDHVFGASAFANEETDIIAHELMPYYLDRLATVVRPVIEKRSYRMFGTFLDESGLVNCGIGHKLMIDENTELGVIRPNITFKDSLEITISGVKLQLFHAPGETNDQLFVWLPDRKVLLCGDNFYRSFPNLYTIRGTPYRDVNQWKESLDKIRYLHPEFLVPSHTRPIAGKDTIFKILTDYRDAIQYVHDQTVRGMNQGLTPDELVAFVRLPDYLAKSPYLQEFYGKVEWSVRSIFTGYLGYYSGDPVDLHPLPPKDRALKMAGLAGGKDELKARMQEAFDDGDYQWTLELSGYLLRISPNDHEASKTRFDALTKLGESEMNPNARHYYLTSALEMKGLEFESLVTPSLNMVHNIPMKAIFNGLAARLNPQKTADIHKVVVFKFPDSGEVFSVFVRKGVAEVQPFEMQEADITITVDATVWKEIAAELRSPLKSFLNGDIQASGGKVELMRFLSWFDRE